MKTIGIIAGNGRFPLLAVQEARLQGYRVVVAGLEKEAEAALEQEADTFTWIKIGALKKLANFFRAEGVHEAIMAGKVEKVRLFQGNLQPDFEMLKVFLKIRDFKDDSLLGAVADYLHEEGIQLLDSTQFMRNALPGSGVLGKCKPSKEAMEDARFGFKMAKAIAALDIGQTVVIKKKAVMAVEAIEGTDATIRRGSELSGGKMTVVKVSKPNQDMRFDVPTIGLKTIQVLCEAKAEVLAFEAGKTLFLEQELVIAEADQAKISLVGICEEDINSLSS